MMATLEALVTQVRAAAADEVEAILRRAVALMGDGKHDLAQVERLVSGDIRALGRMVLGAGVETMDNGKTTSHRACGCGGTQRYVSDRTKELTTLMGPVGLRRAGNAPYSPRFPAGTAA